MHYPVEDDVPVGLECTEEALAKIDEWMESGIASFDDDKKMVVKCACQNYVFTTEQAAALMAKMTWDSGQMEMLEMFQNRLTNPEEADPILAFFDDEDEQEKVKEILAGCTVAETREMGVFPVEDDGVRDEEEVGRFVSAIMDASFESDRMELVDAEMENMPSPPFDFTQLSRVLDEIKWSSEAAQLTEKMSAVGAIYPMLCDEMKELLGKYMGSSDKLQMLAAFKPVIKDAQNKALLVAAFEFPSDKTEAEEILRDVFVIFKPEVPPEEKIQEAIRQIGTCAAGYAWRPVAGGYRCAAGGHFLSQALIDAQLELMD